MQHAISFLCFNDVVVAELQIFVFEEELWKRCELFIAILLYWRVFLG